MYKATILKNAASVGDYESSYIDSDENKVIDNIFAENKTELLNGLAIFFGKTPDEFLESVKFNDDPIVTLTIDLPIELNKPVYSYTIEISDSSGNFVNPFDN